jgi:hypothetical protein
MLQVAGFFYLCTAASLTEFGPAVFLAENVYNDFKGMHSAPIPLQEVS